MHAIQKRLETNIKNRKSTRLTVFDSIRNLPRCESPPPVSETQMKVEHRRQQLEKWKAEKEQKKKEQAAQKKKPFVAGVPRNPLKFVPPPPPPAKPSTSGRVTRSQTKNAAAKPRHSPVKITPKSRSTQSFAPKNAAFKAPEIKNLVKMPTLVPPSKTKSKKASLITFDPVMPNAPNTTRQTRARPVLTRQNATETKVSSRSRAQVDTRSNRGKVTKPSPKKLTKNNLQSSSSGSDLEPRVVIQRVKTPKRKPVKEAKELTPKKLAISSTSEENSSDTSGTDSRLRSRKSNIMIDSSQSSSDKLSSDVDPSSVEEQSTIVMIRSRKSLPKNFSPGPLRSESSSDKLSSDMEFIQDKSPVIKLKRKSLPATPKNRVPKSESSSEEKLRSPKTPIDVPLTPEQMETAKISPCVTLSRGKDNARKEMKWKIDEGLLDDDVSDMESIDHFRKQLSSEITRITEMCDAWDRIFAQTVLPESVQEAVLAAVGQARLLMSQKLQQFASLVERCAAPEPGAALVTPADLHGFWDMVFMQVENVDMRFKKLEALRARGWTEDKPVVEAKKIASKPAVKRAAKPSGPSRLRDMIAAARKAKKDQDRTESSLLPHTEGEKTFDAGFFSVRSPVKSPLPAPATPAAKNNLLKAVLSSEAKKASNSKNSTPFAMLRASMLGKAVEYDGVAPLPQTPQMTPVNLYATPGRSILKSTNINAGKSGKKSIKVVLFDDSDTEALDQSFKTISDNNDIESISSSLKDLSKELIIESSKKSDKENSKVMEVSLIRTRSQRKSLQNHSNAEESAPKEVPTPRRSSRKKKGESEEVKKTPNRQSSRKKVADVEKSTEVEKTHKRSTRKKALQEVETNVMEETVSTPKRSSRRSKALVC
ncbi:disks large-associated protein 5 isoform X2 [Pectinophora gossypiella]|uniref:disks large-associated protein 5 isoform X2 n=1 Tax=Pectinophora gossypiella TaxID=13191 RepID=UPI00214E56BF|nr:disks large-associated protein 5 isoform X2 [Pectinophora gossypiella]